VPCPLAPPPGGEGAAALPAGSLLLYTDGLVETRNRGFDEGIGVLSAVLADLDVDLAPPQIADALVEAMVGDDPEDGVALLAICIDQALSQQPQEYPALGSP
jgi:chemotaxis family two-component system sensor kinase Cph1